MGNTDARDKRPIERSAAYPIISLPDAIEFVTEISKHYTATQIINRDDIAIVLRKAAATIIRDVAAAAQYSLLLKHKDGYQISQLFKDYCNPISEKERKKILLEIFKSPKLFSDLIEKYDGHAVPLELKTHLIRFHKIAERAAPDAAEVFFDSARYAGVLSDNNVLNFAKTYDGVNNPNIQYAEVIVEDTKSANEENVNLINHNNSHQLLLPEGNTEEKVRIPLSDKKVAYLLYP
jgi:hypothetical protein